MSYGNWKYILAVFSFHISVFNGISINNTTWRDPLPYFWPPFFFFLSFFNGFDACVSSSSFFSFSFHTRWLLLLPSLHAVSGFLFLFFFLLLSWSSVLPFFFLLLSLGSVFNSCFFFFFLLLSLGLGFWISLFFFFFPWVRWVWVLGKKKKLHRVADMGPTNSVKNIEWWQVSDGVKRVGYFKWWVMSDGNWVMKNIDPNCPYILPIFIFYSTIIKSLRWNKDISWGL